MATRGLGVLGEVRTYLIILESPGPEQVAQALSGGAGSVVVADGDGMQWLVARASAGTGVPLRVLATGIVCVYSRNPGLPCGLASVALAMTGVSRSIDLGWASLDDGSPESSLMATGMGQDTEVLLGVRNNLKKRLGWVAYV